MNLQDELFTTWFRPGKHKLYILTDVEATIVEQDSSDGYPVGMELATTVILTPVGAASRKESIQVDATDFIEGVRTRQLRKIVASLNVEQLGIEVTRNFK